VAASAMINKTFDAHDDTKTYLNHQDEDLMNEILGEL
jgi:hypothetical protein